MLERSKREDSTAHKSYAMMAFSYVGAMLASNQALQYVSYPTQVLGKSIKPIPVMILGVLYAHKKYPLKKYAFVLMITLGVALFMFKDRKGGLDSDHLVGWGEVLLIVSLLLDGMTGAVQERARSENRTQAYHMMINMNIWAVLYLGVALLVTGEGYNFVLFSFRFPSVFFQMFTFSIMSAIGQVFIFVTVTTFGPLTCSIITTTRKFFTILASVVIFQHPMSSRQWMGTLLVFVGLSLDSLYGKERKTLQKPVQK